MNGFPKFPFDPSEMFDPSKMADMMRGDFGKMFKAPTMPGLDPSELMSAQQRNLAAFQAANEAAAEGYKELFKNQVAVFEKTLEAARAHAESFDPGKDPASTMSAQAEFAKSAAEAAVKNMTDLAEEARKANAEAFRIVSDRIEASVEELKSTFKV